MLRAELHDAQMNDAARADDAVETLAIGGLRRRKPRWRNRPAKQRFNCRERSVSMLKQRAMGDRQMAVDAVEVKASKRVHFVQLGSPVSGESDPVFWYERHDFPICS